MDVQAAPSPYTPAGASFSPMGNPPVLGPQVPGTTGGLPAQAGLSALSNPMPQQLQSQSPMQPQQAAQHTQQYGRGDDTMLIHMTPNEVNSLRGLAQQFGGDLTQNPHTGLPEAGWLGNLLPTILGGVLAATGVGAPLAAGLVGLGQTAITGDLSKGLMAGLGAFGGASLAGAAGVGSSLSKNAFGVLGDKAGVLGANMGTGAATSGGTMLGADVAADSLAKGALNTIPEQAAAAVGKTADIAGNTLTKTPGFFGKFASTARQGLPGGMISKAAPMMAGLGALNSVSGAMTPGFTNIDGRVDNSYQGPYTAQKREASFAPNTADILSSSKERDYFNVDSPEIYNTQGQVVQPGSQTTPGTMIYQNVLNPKAKKGQPMYSSRGTPYMSELDPGYGMGYAKGGEVELADGAFVLDARTVSELGNGSSSAGHELLARLGGRPVRGSGDGVSDSVPARIGRNQPARVARDEVVFSPEAVRRVGKGSEKRGAAKLYALMEKAHKARKKSERGKDTGLRRGLA